jgi:hypothetical protein
MVGTRLHVTLAKIAAWKLESHEVPAPSAEQVHALACEVAKRTRRLRQRRGLVDEQGEPVAAVSARQLVIGAASLSMPTLQVVLKAPAKIMIDGCPTFTPPSKGAPVITLP